MLDFPTFQTLHPNTLHPQMAQDWQPPVHKVEIPLPPKNLNEMKDQDLSADIYGGLNLGLLGKHYSQALHAHTNIEQEKELIEEKCHQMSLKLSNVATCVRLSKCKSGLIRPGLLKHLTDFGFKKLKIFKRGFQERSRGYHEPDLWADNELIIDIEHKLMWILSEEGLKREPFKWCEGWKGRTIQWAPY